MYSYIIFQIEFNSDTPRIIFHRFHEKTYSGEMFRCQNENISRTSRKIHVDIINLYSSESPCNSNT